MRQLKGSDLERTYRRAHAYFGRPLEGLRVVSSEALDRIVEEALRQGRITWDERTDVLLADLGISTAGARRLVSGMR